MNRAERALQIWQVLIGAARHRQTLTYELLGEMIGMPPFALAHPLDRVQRHCQQSGLPPLTVLVVGKQTGHSSAGYAPAREEGMDRESVFSFSWYGERPRQVSDFQREGEDQVAEEE